MSDKTKHLLVCATTSALVSAGIALLLWVSLVVTSCEELMEHLLAPVWFSGIACALAMGVGKEYGDNPPYSTVSKINDGSVSSPTSYESFKSFIDNVIAGKDFGTLTIHGFSIITSTLFEQVLDYIHQKVAEGVLDVKTWGEVYDASKID